MDRLLELLKTNGRASAADLARLMSVSEEEVTSRLEALERDGTIVGYQALFDPEKTGNGAVEAVIEVRITPERGGGFNLLAARISKFEEVQSCYLMSGGYDLLVIVQGKNLQAIGRFIAEKLSTIKGVLSTATHFRLKAYKENGIYLHREAKPQRLAVSP
ncbi:MAG: Lrp/AsnC family transcriptional regulator [Chthoniobacteraceae bacterium]